MSIMSELLGFLDVIGQSKGEPPLSRFFDPVAHENARRQRALEQNGRKYMSPINAAELIISDVVNETQWEAYRKASGGIIGVTVEFDHSGELSLRGRPDSGQGYAVITVNGEDANNAYWDALDPLLAELEQTDQSGESDV